jgi:hypothetical protein
MLYSTRWGTEVRPGSLKKLYRGRKRRINMDRWIYHEKEVGRCWKHTQNHKGKQIDSKYASK